MTVVLAIVCADGVVIGSDSQITDSTRGLSFPAQKLHPLGDHAAWGGSGARGVLDDLRTILADDAEAIIAAPDVGDAVQERVLPVLHKHYENYIPEVPGEDSGGGVSAYVLAAGVSNGRRWIVEVNPNGLLGRYDDIGFHAIGSGSAMAQQAGALLGHFQMTERSVDHGVVGMVRVLDALDATSPSIGGPIDVARIDAEGAHHLSEEEITDARDHVVRWKAMEHEVLDRLFDEGRQPSAGRTRRTSRKSSE